MRTIFVSPAVVVFMLGLWACDPGSTVVTQAREDGCVLTATRHSDGFSIELQLGCEAPGSNCFVVESLRCQGQLKAGSVPIDLTSENQGCPGASWCTASCENGPEAPGSVWDTPALLEVEGCNVYEDAPSAPNGAAS